MKLIKPPLLIIVFFIGLIGFLPKANLFFLCEKALLEHKVSINYDTLTQTPLQLSVDKASLLYDTVRFGTLSSLEIKPWIFYNALKIDAIIIEGNAFKMLPKKLDNLVLKHTLLNPHHLFLSALSDLGEIEGFIDLYHQTFILHVKPSNEGKKKYADILRQFSLQKEGFYRYETTISIY